MNSSSVSAAKTADNGVKGRSGAARAGQGRYAADGSRRLRGTPAERSGVELNQQAYPGQQQKRESGVVMG